MPDLDFTAKWFICGIAIGFVIGEIVGAILSHV